MNPDASNKPQPQQALSPEEDLALLAIEAREAREGDLDRPFARPGPRVQPRPVAPRTTAPRATPLVIEPVLPPTPVAPTPVVVTPQLHPKPAPKPTPAKKPVVVTPPEPIRPPKPKQPAEPHWKHSTDIVEVLADAPAVVSSRGLFKPFANQVRSHKGAYVAIAAVVIISLTVVLYFFMQQ